MEPPEDGWTCSKCNQSIEVAEGCDNDPEEVLCHPCAQEEVVRLREIVEAQSKWIRDTISERDGTGVEGVPTFNWAFTHVKYLNKAKKAVDEACRYSGCLDSHTFSYVATQLSRFEHCMIQAIHCLDHLAAAPDGDIWIEWIRKRRV
jgi:hypothetical protein